MRKYGLACVFFAVFCAAGVFAGEQLPAAAIDWPEKLGMTHKMLFLVLQIGIILFAAKLGGMFATLFKLPSVLGELGAGILIGPWALGGVPIPGFDGLFQHGLFYGHALRAQAAAGGNPFAATPELYGICTIASVVLLFLSGVETNLKMFLKYAFAGSLVGVGGVVFSFVFGDLCAVYAVKFLPDQLSSIRCLRELGDLVAAGKTMEAILSPAALFMGIMSTATSVGITARILSERKKMDSAEGVTIMAGAVIDDVLGIIVLAIGMGIIGAQQEAARMGAAAHGVPWGKIGGVALQAFGVWLGGTVIGVVFARRISGLLKLFKSPVAIATLAFGLSLVIAGIFETLGLTLIIGAYVMGLALSRTDIKNLVQEHLQSVYTFLVPVFFCVMGMMVDVDALCSKPVLVFGAIYTVLAILAKTIGCAIPSLFCGFNVLGSLRVGAGMIPRGEVALIIAGIGLANGFLTQEVFGIGILMTLVTTIVAPPALVALFVPKKRGVWNTAETKSDSRHLAFELPTTQVAEIMINRLVQEFRHEGFFTSKLSDEGDVEIWSFSMDDEELTVTRDNKTIRATCGGKEEACMRQAWTEVVSQMKQLAKVISTVMREKDGMENLITESDEDVKLGNARRLRNFVMLPAFTAYSKREAIETLVDAIAERNPHHVKDVDAAKEAVFLREESMPTGLDHGIAVPHGRTDAVDEIVGAVALVNNVTNEIGCISDYDTIDHSAIQIIVLTLAPKSAHCPYLQMMAAINSALHSNNGYLELLQCKTEDEMRKFFKDK